MINEDPKMLDGVLHNFTLTLKGKQYRCGCGCNVFHKPDKARDDVYRCNSCESTFETD